MGSLTCLRMGEWTLRLSLMGAAVNDDAVSANYVVGEQAIDVAISRLLNTRF